MPFTPAHAAAVLPLARPPLPLTALVAGSMVPDLPLFLRDVPDLPVLPAYSFTHSLLGIVTVDVVLGVLAVTLWLLWLRDPLVDLGPRWSRHRLPARGDRAAVAWRWVPVAAAVGAATHVGWDAFTHRGRWGTELVPWLTTPHGPLNGYRWAQYVSGVVGLAVVAVVAWRRLASRRPHERGPVVPGARTSALLAAVALAVLGGALGLVSYAAEGAKAAAFLAADGFAVGVLLSCTGWQLRARCRGGADGYGRT